MKDYGYLIQWIFRLYLLTVVVVFSGVISLLFVAADYTVIASPTAPERDALIRLKYVILAGYPLLGWVVGCAFRWRTLYGILNNHKSVWRFHWEDIALKTGVLSAGLTLGKLVGITAIMQQIAADADTFVSTDILIMAAFPIVVIVSAAILAAREVINKSPELRM